MHNFGMGISIWTSMEIAIEIFMLSSVYTQPIISVRIRSVIFRMTHNIRAMICKKSFCIILSYSMISSWIFYAVTDYISCIFRHCPNILYQCEKYRKIQPESASDLIQTRYFWLCNLLQWYMHNFGMGISIIFHLDRMKIAIEILRLLPRVYNIIYFCYCYTFGFYLSSV